MIILHILLGILKWLGIILLALLCILLLLILIILLTPVRYRVEAEKQTESFKEVKAMARVSWMLSAVSFSFLLEGGTKTMVLHIFGHSPEEYKNFIKKLRKKKEKPAEAAPAALEEKQEKAEPTETEPAEKPGADTSSEPQTGSDSVTGSEAESEVEDVFDEELEPDEVPVEEETDGQTSDSANEGEKKPDVKEQISAVLEKVRAKALALKEKIGNKEKAEPKAEPKTEEDVVKVSLKNRLQALAEGLIESVAAFLRPILVKIGHFLIKLPTYVGLGVMYAIKYTLYLGMGILGAPFFNLGIPDFIREKFADIEAKADKVLDFLKTKEGKKLLRLLKKELIKILRIVLPRRLRGNLILGLDDPSMVGEIYGGLVLIKAMRGRKFMKEFSFEPDFEQMRIEGKIRMDGHIRLGSFVVIALRLIIDPCVWKAIKLVKNL